VRWDALQTILRDDVAVPPKLAAAVFIAAASLPGTVLLRHVVDAAGRPGIAVAMQQYGVSSELIFDPRTYRFTGSADVVTRQGSDTGNFPIGTIYFTMALCIPSSPQLHQPCPATMAMSISQTSSASSRAECRGYGGSERKCCRVL
jgi:hypothetical protein